MILTIDIGNTTVALGGVEGEQGGYAVRFTARLPTDLTWDGAAYEKGLLDVLTQQGLGPEDLEGAVLSSVVPAVEKSVAQSVQRVLGKPPVVITAESATGLTFAVPEPEKVGRDRLADGAWAAASCPLPAITVDLGTATTFNVIGKGGVFLGGAIAAGVATGLHALADRTAQLPALKVETPKGYIGRDTAECMAIGAVAGAAALVDGLVRGMERELGEPVTLLLTGGAAGYVSPLVEHPHTYDPDLLLKGLALLYEKNR
jgi:type III pantothenate kinase